MRQKRIERDGRVRTASAEAAADDAAFDADAITAGTAALFGATWGDRASTALQNKSPGAGVAWDGVTVFQSGDIPVGDTTGWTNFVCVTGPMAAIEMPVWQELLPFIQPDESRFGTWLGVSIIAEPGIVKNANARAFITRT